MVMVDDCHSTGFVGATGRGTHEHCGVMGRVDILTGTLGKALGGRVGRVHGGVSKAVVDWLQATVAALPLFSNTLAPVIAGASLTVFDLLGGARRGDLRAHGCGRMRAIFRERMGGAGL